MNVVTYLPHGAIPDVRGFAPAIVAWNLACHLRFSQFHIICNREDYIQREEVYPGIGRVHRLKEGRLYTRLFKKISRLDPYSLHRRAAKLARSLAPDIVHAHQLEFPIEAFFNILGRRLPVIVHAHVTNRAFDAARGIADKYIAASGYVRERLINQGGYPSERIEVIRNGVDTALFCPPTLEERGLLRQILGIPIAGRVVLFAGRKQEVKGFPIFLEVAKKLLAHHPDVFIVAAGGEPRECAAESTYATRNALRARLASRGRYFDLPPMPQSQLANLFKVSDIALLPSLQEPQGMTMLESMSSSCITVSSRVGGIPESISHGESGFLIENPHDADEVLHLVEKVLDNLENLEPLRVAARKQIIENCSWSKLAMRLETIYFDVAAGHWLAARAENTQ